MLRLAAFAVTSALTAAAAGPLPPLPLGRLLSSPDRLTIEISKSGNRLVDGTHRLECHPAGGDHPFAEEACARLDTLARQGKDPFAESDAKNCSFQYGGSAVAHVTGTWRGQKVDTTFQRRNGCDIARWKNLEPVLPGEHS
ncbi:SSI family serine proteinase inhibitor [Streptomyces sp. C]|uniref:SSI family serine proteinase inhibitor n=1 Tax=Streptomyces sp. C TaxID=253839 RepID=UPI0001B57CDF|nr:SSI family serine proteinase inhibitor [Streptomyces sp. C]EFL16390.1 secreted protein [Streptomyces sp. C]